LKESLLVSQWQCGIVAGTGGMPFTGKHGNHIAVTTMTSVTAMLKGNEGDATS